MQNCIIQQSVVNVQFLRPSQTEFPGASVTEILYFASLDGNKPVDLTYFYSNQSEIQSKCTTSNTHTCGDYELNGIFHADAKFCNYRFLGLITGFPVKFEISENYKDVKYYTQEFFSESYPIQSKKVNFHIPDWMEVELHPFNLEGIQHQVDTSYDEKKHETIICYSLKDLPAFKEEKNSTSVSANYPHVLVCSKSYLNTANKKVNLISSLNDLYSWYHSLVLKVNNDTAALRPLVNQLVSDCKQPSEKVRNIFHWVQDNIRYIAFEYEMAGFVPENAQNVYVKRYGDCKGLSNLTKVLLCMAGFDARLCWIGTNTITYDYSTPSLAVDNHMICALIENNKMYFLDPTATYTNVGEYPEYIQGKQVLIENGGEYLLDTVPDLGCDINATYFNFDLRIEGDLLSGNMCANFYGNERAKILSVLNSTSVEDKYIVQNLLFNNDKNIIWDQNRATINTLRDTSFRFETKIQLKKNVYNVGNKLIIKAVPLEIVENDFIDTSRFNGYNFGEKRLIEYRVVIELPDGYEIFELPKPFIFETNRFGVEYNYTKQNGQIHFIRRLYLNEAILKREDFNHWNNFLKTIRKENNNRIILQKT